MNRPDPTFDLIAVQRLNGAYLDTLATDIPGSGALARLRHMEAEHDFGAGTTLMLVPTADPLPRAVDRGRLRPAGYGAVGTHTTARRMSPPGRHAGRSKALATRIAHI
jgi:hypothetical protein